MLHWSALARLATSCASKASNKDEKKNTTYSALVICTMHSTSLFHSTVASQRRFLSKNPKNPCYDAVDPLPSSHRSPLHFSQPLVLHRWGEVGVRDEKLSGLNSGFCMGTFSSGWSLHPGTFSSVWSLHRNLLTQGSLNYTCRFTI